MKLTRLRNMRLSVVTHASHDGNELLGWFNSYEKYESTDPKVVLGKIKNVKNI